MIKRIPNPVGRPTEPIEERFWKRVERDTLADCWNWKGATTSNGYGKIRIGPITNRKLVRAHRLSWELHYGPIPADKLVLHRCDNKRCVNPNHLYLGTYSDNIQDAWDRGLRPRILKQQGGHS